MISGLWLCGLYHIRWAEKMSSWKSMLISMTVKKRLLILAIWLNKIKQNKTVPLWRGKKNQRTVWRCHGVRVTVTHCVRSVCGWTGLQEERHLAGPLFVAFIPSTEQVKQTQTKLVCLLWPGVDKLCLISYSCNYSQQARRPRPMWGLISVFLGLEL